MLILTFDKLFCKSFAKSITQEFEMILISELTFVLGLQNKQSNDENLISQINLLKRLNMKNSKITKNSKVKLIFISHHHFNQYFYKIIYR